MLGTSAIANVVGEVLGLICAHENKFFHEECRVTVRKNYPNAMNRKFLAEAVSFAPVISRCL